MAIIDEKVYRYMLYLNQGIPIFNFRGMTTRYVEEAYDKLISGT